MPLSDYDCSSRNVQPIANARPLGHHHLMARAIVSTRIVRRRESCSACSQRHTLIELNGSMCVCVCARSRAASLLRAALSSRRRQATGPTHCRESVRDRASSSTQPLERRYGCNVRAGVVVARSSRAFAALIYWCTCVCVGSLLACWLKGIKISIHSMRRISGIGWHVRRVRPSKIYVLFASWACILTIAHGLHADH